MDYAPIVFRYSHKGWLLNLKVVFDNKKERLQYLETVKLEWILILYGHMKNSRELVLIAGR